MDLTKKTSFEFVRYSKCWEDANILLNGLDVKAGERVLSICSGGDNSFALLANDPSLVVAVDLSQAQLYVAQLKKAALQSLNYDKLLEFLGYQPCNNRLTLYSTLSPMLEKECKAYWDDNHAALIKGIVHIGKFEKYLRAFAQYFVPLIHSKKKIYQLFDDKSEKEQTAFFKRKWNNWRWKLLFKIFFSKTIMGRFGRDPEFLRHTKVHVATYIKNRADMHLQSKNAQNNMFLEYCLKGEFGKSLPEYLQPSNYNKVVANLDKIHFVKGYTDEVFKYYTAFDKMNMSNIFEYMDEATFEETAKQLTTHLNRGGRIAYWNLMVDRLIAPLQKTKLKHLTSLSSCLTAVDRGFFYKSFNVDLKF